MRIIGGGWPLSIFSSELCCWVHHGLHRSCFISNVYPKGGGAASLLVVKLIQEGRML